MKKMLGKTWLIAIATLFVLASVLPSISAINEAEELQPQPLAIYWEDNFDSYANGQGLHGTGGWEGWFGDPTWDAFVTDAQSHSSPHSVDIVADADIVQVFSGANSGIWTMTCWVYTPGAFAGLSYFILLNTYVTTQNWSTQVRFDSDQEIIESEFDGAWLPLLTDQWVEFKVEIDFDIDSQSIYYDGDLLVTKSWTDGVSGGGALNLEALDLFANGATSMYWDDFVLEGPDPVGPDLDCDGVLNFDIDEYGQVVTGEFTVENIGAPGSLLDWEVDSYPSWGTWTFDPASGTDLTPEDGPVTVSVEVVGPDSGNEPLTGEVRIVNSEDSYDFCIIDAEMLDSVSFSTPFLNWLMNRPIIGRIIERLIS